MTAKRMFSSQITESDAFLDMPLSAQSLYFHLGMNADDQGFVNSPRRVQRMVGASGDDMKLLLAKNFLILFESGVVVIKHWRINNVLKTDRIKPTVYQEEMAMLEVKDNKAYTLKNEPLDSVGDSCFQNGSRMSPKCLQSGSVNQSNINQSNINQSIYIRNLINNSDMDRLTDLYGDVDKLLELVDHRIRQRSEQTPIKNPLGYVMAIAREENWPTREEAERKASAREARIQEIEAEDQREKERLNQIARNTFRKGE